MALTETFRFYEAELVASRRRLREAQSRSLRRRVKATGAVQERLLRQHADVDAVARGVNRWKGDLLPLLRHSTVDFERWLPPSVLNRSDDEQRTLRKSAWPRRWMARLTRRPQEPAPVETQPPPRPRETWLETQAREILARAEHVVGGSQEINDVIRTISEATSAQANRRLQRQVAILTWVLAFIGIATLIVVIFTAK